MVVGVFGAAVPTVAVVIEVGAEARLETAKLNGPPSPPVVIFWTATVAGLAALVIVQLICAAGKTFAAGTVMTLPVKLPKLAGLPVKLEFASEQLADDAVKLALIASVICICVFAAMTWIVTGETGVAVAAAVVLIFAGFETRFVAVNVNGPPNELDVIFCNVSVAGFGVFVKVQMIFEKSFKLIAGTVITLPAKVPKLAGFPVVPELVSVHVPADITKFAFAASVNVTGLALLETILLIGVVGAAVPAVVVVIFGGRPVKFVAVKLNGPPARPVVIF